MMLQKNMKMWLFLFVLQSAMLVFAGTIFADTEVGGNITEDTTWTKSNSPYIVMNTVQILEGVKLTIEPGVQIKFKKDTGLNIDGELSAIGTEENYIIFTSGEMIGEAGNWLGIYFTNDSQDVIFNSYGVYVSGSIIKNCVIEFAQDGISSRYSSQYIFNNLIRNNQVGIRLYYSGSRIQDSEISYNTINGIVFTHYDVSGSGDFSIIRNKISNNGESGLLGKQNTSAPIYQNEIKNNKVGISFSGTYTNPDIKENNIVDNLDYAIKFEYDNIEDVQAPYNYWGTTDESVLDQIIYDYYDNVDLSKVDYLPLATQPFDFSGGIISGIVKDKLSEVPVAGANIIVINSGIQKTTGNDGAYLFENLSPGNYSINVIAPKYHQTIIDSVSILSGTTIPLDIPLEPKTTGIVTGQTLSSAGLTPIPNITIKISNESENFSAISDSIGNFTFADITHGDYSIEIDDPSYYDTPQNILVNIDETTEVSLIGISQTTIDEIRKGWFTQEQLDQAVSHAETAKDLIITEKEQIITTLNDDIAQKEQTIIALNATIASMFSKEQLDQAIADAEAANDLIISDKDQIITDLNKTIEIMFTQEQLEQAVDDAITVWDKNTDGVIGLEEVIYRLQVLSGIKK